jgi:HPt (histidine-containing phosphotransfer) domain-containing protein
MNQDFKNMMAELKTEYLIELPDKINYIETLLEQTNQVELENEFHKLKGTGKTYGVPEVTDICEIAEEACTSNVENWLDVSQNAILELKNVVKLYS